MEGDDCLAPQGDNMCSGNRSTSVGAVKDTKGAAKEKAF